MSNSNAANSSVSFREKIGYAIGDSGFNFYWIIIGSYLSYFYTDIFGISAAAAGTMFLVTKIVDACTDPVMGAVADRTQTRWGKFRPYLLFGALPMAGAAVLTLSTPDLSEDGKLAWAYGTYSLMMLCYTILSTPYSSLAGVITADPVERNSIFGWRFFFAYFTGILVGAFTPGLADYFADGDPAKGWQMTMMLYAAVASILFLVTFLSTRERINPPKEQSSKPMEDIKDLLDNRPWLIVFALAMIIMMTIVFRGSSATYYFKYYVNRPDLMGVFIGVQMMFYAIGCLLSPYLTQWMDKAKLLMVLMGIVGVCSVLFAFIPQPEYVGVKTLSVNDPKELRAEEFLGPHGKVDTKYQWFEHRSGLFWFNTEKIPISDDSDVLMIEGGADSLNESMVVSVTATLANGDIHDSASWPREIVWMFILNVLISLALGPKSPITWSMYADAADYNVWKTSRRATAMTFSAATFSQKIGGALGSAGILWVLAWQGYSANQIQEDASLDGIVWLQTIVPALFAFIAIFALRFYNLDAQKLAKIQSDIEERNTDN